MLSRSFSSLAIAAATLASLVMIATTRVTAAATLQQHRIIARQIQEAGTPLYLDTPSCDFYQCSINWYAGDTVTAHWTDAPAGNVVLDMMTDAGATFVYNVATVPGTTNNCDKEGQDSCGQFSWIVPSQWVNGSTYGNYTLRATSSSQPELQSYTDIILVRPANGTAAETPIPFKALDPTVNDSGANATSTAAPANTTASATGSGAAGSANQTSTGAAASPTTAQGGANSAASFVSNGMSVAVQGFIMFLTVAYMALAFAL